jgi:hypothetical protein
MQREGDGARAVIAGGEERGVTTTEYVRQADQLIARQMISCTAAGTDIGAAASPFT